MQQNCRHGVSVKRVNSHNNDDASHAKRSTHGVKSPFGTATTAGARTCVPKVFLSVKQLGQQPTHSGTYLGCVPVQIQYCNMPNVSVVQPQGAGLLVQPVGGDFVARFYPLVTNTMFITLTIVTFTARCNLHMCTL